VTRRTPRQRFFQLVRIAAAVGLVLFCLHAPKYEQLKITYRGSSVVAPDRYILDETMLAKRCIPLVSCSLPRIGIMTGLRRAERYTRERKSRVRPDIALNGISLSVATADIFSVGAYETSYVSLLAESGKHAGVQRHVSECAAPDRYKPGPGGGKRADFHILDLGTPSFFEIPLPDTPPGGEVTVDFDSIVYTQFIDQPGREGWPRFGEHCLPGNHEAVPFSVGVPRVFRYGISAQPSPQPRQPLPAASDKTYAFIVGYSEVASFLTDRPGMENWERLRAAEKVSGNLRVVLDQVAKTVTVEVRASMPGSSLDLGSLIVIVGTPSSDGRYFGIDFLHMSVE
jgi:hypothetical protein